MFTALYKKLRLVRIGGHLCMGALFALFSQVAQANNEFFLEGYEEYGLDSNDFNKMRILPTRLMDNKTLFLAAEAERDTSMSMSQRLINNRWLLDEKRYSESGMAAVRRYFRMSILENYRSNRRKSSINKQDGLLPIKRQSAYSQFGDLSNYHFKLSDDKFKVQFRYRFD